MDKNLKEIKKNWSKLTPLETTYIVIFARILLIKEKISKIRPRQLIIPTSILQILLFSISTLTNYENKITIFAVGNMIIMGIAIAPMTVWKPRAHWIK